MSSADVTLSLPTELIERARQQGILTDQRVAMLLEAEIERIERWHALDQSLEPVREAFRKEYGHLTEDEVMDMINDVVHEVRAEMRAEREAKPPEHSAS